MPLARRPMSGEVVVLAAVQDHLADLVDRIRKKRYPTCLGAPPAGQRRSAVDFTAHIAQFLNALPASLPDEQRDFCVVIFLQRSLGVPQEITWFNSQDFRH